MEWVRGEAIGYGSFSTVNLATTSSLDQIAVKSSDLADSSQLKNEKQVLDNLGPNPNIIRCLGADVTFEKNGTLYNLLLEYAPGGTLAQKVKSSGGKIPEKEVRSYTRSILKGLGYIHEKRYAHCDIKLQNLLLFEKGNVKIADFGLAKKVGVRVEGVELRGTPAYMAPESVNENEYGTACDVWGVGCAVVEMVSGRPVWEGKEKKEIGNVMCILMKIGVGDEVPLVPEELSENGKDFVRKCFVKDPKFRWTAEMLLGHPWLDLDGQDEELGECGARQDCVVSHDEIFSNVTQCNRAGEGCVGVSPRGVFDFPEEWEAREEEKAAAVTVESLFRDSVVVSAGERIRKLVGGVSCEWSDSGSWISVR